MVAWMAYAAGAAGLLAAGAFLLEKVSEQTGWPRRFAWLAGLALALLVPLFASPPKPTPGTEAYSVENDDYNPDNPFSEPVSWIEPTRYDVFESDGTYLGAVATPDGFSSYPNPSSQVTMCGR